MLHGGQIIDYAEESMICREQRVSFTSLQRLLVHFTTNSAATRSLTALRLGLEGTRCYSSVGGTRSVGTSSLYVEIMSLYVIICIVQHFYLIYDTN